MDDINLTAMRKLPLSVKAGPHAVELRQADLVDLLRGEHHFRVLPGLPEDARLVGIMLPGLRQRGDIITLLFDQAVPQPIVHRLPCDPGGER